MASKVSLSNVKKSGQARKLRKEMASKAVIRVASEIAGDQPNLNRMNLAEIHFTED